MLRLFEILDFEFVLIKVCLAFVELLYFLLLRLLLLLYILLELFDLNSLILTLLQFIIKLLLNLLLVVLSQLLLHFHLAQFFLLLLNLVTKLVMLIILLELELLNFIFMSVFLLIQFLQVIVSELCRKVLTLLVLFVDFAKIDLEFFEQAIDCRLVLLLDLLNLLFVALLHLEAFLLKL